MVRFFCLNTLPFYAISDQLLLNAGTERHPQSAAVLCSATTHPVYFNAVYFSATDEVIGAVRGAVTHMYDSLFKVDTGCFTKPFCQSSPEM